LVAVEQVFHVPSLLSKLLVDVVELVVVDVVGVVVVVVVSCV